VPKVVCLDALWNNPHAGMHRADLHPVDGADARGGARARPHVS